MLHIAGHFRIPYFLVVLDDLLARFRSLELWAQAVIVFAVLFVLILILPDKLTTKAVVDKPMQQPHCRALGAFLVPRVGAWPRASPLFYTHNGRVHVSLSRFIDSICLGEAELKDPNQLAALFLDNFAAYNWRVSLKIDTSWLLYVSGCLFSTQFQTRQTSQAHDLTPKPMTLPSLLLDLVPYGQTEKCIDEFFSSLPSQSSATIQFSTLASSIQNSPINTPFILCALPLLPRRHKSLPSNQATTSRLYTSLSKIIDLLQEEKSSASITLTIRSVQNQSQAHAESLREHYGRLATDNQLRSEFIEQYQQAGWREQRLWLVWEAALLDAGYMYRWNIDVWKG